MHSNINMATKDNSQGVQDTRKTDCRQVGRTLKIWKQLMFTISETGASDRQY